MYPGVLARWIGFQGAYSRIEANNMYAASYPTLWAGTRKTIVELLLGRCKISSAISYSTVDRDIPLWVIGSEAIAERLDQVHRQPAGVETLVPAKRDSYSVIPPQPVISAWCVSHPA